ncbi:hypothetical protein J6590_047273 [Homalodisca vitripennis]|nr:hypothetical protein J6590_047273 [Homalodisca vitripennis]
MGAGGVRNGVDNTGRSQHSSTTTGHTVCLWRTCSAPSVAAASRYVRQECRAIHSSILGEKKKHAGVASGRQLICLGRTCSAPPVAAASRYVRQECRAIHSSILGKK